MWQLRNRVMSLVQGPTSFCLAQCLSHSKCLIVMIVTTVVLTHGSHTHISLVLEWGCVPQLMSKEHASQQAEGEFGVLTVCFQLLGWLRSKSDGILPDWIPNYHLKWLLKRWHLEIKGYCVFRRLSSARQNKNCWIHPKNVKNFDQVTKETVMCNFRNKNILLSIFKGHT